MTFIPEEDAEKALHYLRDSAAKLAKARESSINAEAYVKRVKAIEFLKAEGPVETRKAIAESSVAVQEAIGEEARAAGEFELLRALRDAAMAKLDAWRTICASARAASK